MEFLYNPDAMSEEEIKGTFVARQWLVDDLMSIIQVQPSGAGLQHVLIIGPRGMGKTTLLLMLQFALRASSLFGAWQPVKFPEESYGIYDLADFWIEVLTLLAADTHDLALVARIETLKSEYRDSDDLQEAALATLKDWSARNGKRIALLVDNLDMILDQINNERDYARLRQILMNDGSVMVVGCAVSFFDQARSYKQPLYNFFKNYDLHSLTLHQMQELLLRRAEMDGPPELLAKLKANAPRIKALEYFTGGNPRLVLMLYKVIALSDLSEVTVALEKLLDQVTPFFKAKVESLPPQQRKILDHIARVIAETREPLTPSQIAEGTRMSPNQVSSQLKRLADTGYVRTANLRGRSTFYMLSEPLYSLWHQMRMGRDTREKMGWLVNFLKAWYSTEEAAAESTKLEGMFRDYWATGKEDSARNILELRAYLAEAMEQHPNCGAVVDQLVQDYLRTDNAKQLRGHLASLLCLSSLSPGTLKTLYHSDSRADLDATLTGTGLALTDGRSPNVRRARARDLASICLEEAKFEDAIRYAQASLASNPKDAMVLQTHGSALLATGRYGEAMESYERAAAAASDPSSRAVILSTQGFIFAKLGWLDRAMEAYDLARGADPGIPLTWWLRAVTLKDLGRAEESVDSMNKGFELVESSADSWFAHGVALSEMDLGELALHCYDRALQKNDRLVEAWIEKGRSLSFIARDEEAVHCYNHALEIDASSCLALSLRGMSLQKLGRIAEAIADYRRALDLGADAFSMRSLLAFCLGELGSWEEALVEFEHSLTIRPDQHIRYFRANCLFNLGRSDEALSELEGVLENEPGKSLAWFHRGDVLLALGRYDDAISSYDTALRGGASQGLGEDVIIERKARAWFQKFSSSLRVGDLSSALTNWREFIGRRAVFDQQMWDELVVPAITLIAKGGIPEFARKLIVEPDVEKRVFPLARALDYLLTGDEEFLEKLPSEIRPAVDEIVAEFRADIAGAPQQAGPSSHTDESKGARQGSAISGKPRTKPAADPASKKTHKKSRTRASSRRIKSPA